VLNSNTNTLAVVLLSGGLDSTTVLAIAQAQGYTCHALSFDYGQRHDFELTAARRVAESMGVEQHLILGLDLRPIGGSALTADIEVPKGRSQSEIEDGVPITYVPARNTVFLSLALGWAETLQCSEIFIGVNSLDYSGYPDCRPEFIKSFEDMANLATALSTEQGRHITIHAPLQQMTKAQIVAQGLELGVDYSLTHSCYDPDERGKSCGSCDSCKLRLKGFADAGAKDPIPYAD
jgi:7-cyano-7-deazaguanine synthase